MIKSSRTLASVAWSWFDLVISNCNRIWRSAVKNSFLSHFSSFCVHLRYWQDFLIWSSCSFSLTLLSLDRHTERHVWLPLSSLPVQSMAQPSFCLYPFLLSCLSPAVPLALFWHLRRSGLLWRTENTVKVVEKKRYLELNCFSSASCDIC